MKRIGFYLYNPGLGQVDCSSIFESNPGIGGTEHIVLLIWSMLSELKDKYEVTMFATEPILGLNCSKVILVASIEEAIKNAESMGIEILIFKHMPEYCLNDRLRCSSPHLSLFPWVHIFQNRKDLDYYYQNENVKRVICVGKEQRDLFLDHPCIRKMCYIYNTLNTDPSYKERVLQHPYKERKHIVTYVGSLVPEKCFHHLAAMWKDIVAEVPDAELYVIGSGAVYDHTKSLGKYGLAQEDYENWFMPYLEENGVLMPSVHFMGRMGKEKEEILLKTKVGVPNPWGLSETFCISAVEMQLCGATVVAGECSGYYDTFINGVIVKDRNHLKDAIVAQLRSDMPVVDYEKTYRKIVEQFSAQKVLSEWENLIEHYNEPLSVPSDSENMYYRMKWVKRISACIKEKLPAVRILPPVENMLQKMEYYRNYRAF